MKRLYYLTKSILSTESISNDLHHAGVTDWNFHVMSQCNESGLYRRQIHSANTLHKSDLIHSAERGVLFGFIVGVAAAWGLSLAPVFGVPTSSFGLVSAVIISVLIGGWLGGFVGIQKENYKIRRFHDQLQDGYFLIMVDVVPGQEHLVHEIMQARHQDAEYCDEDSTVITPFDHHKPISH